MTSTLSAGLALVRAPECRTQAWWRDAVTCQVYPRSWADADGDGVGDLDEGLLPTDTTSWVALPQEVS
ncbi:MAG: hypothetical protein ABI746_07945 [Dermatophilaceae bacterium]